MTGEHGGCCCNHDDQHRDHNQDQHDIGVQDAAVITSGDTRSCCDGAANDVQAPQSTDHAGNRIAMPSSS